MPPLRLTVLCAVGFRRQRWWPDYPRTLLLSPHSKRDYPRSPSGCALLCAVCLCWLVGWFVYVPRRHTHTHSRSRRSLLLSFRCTAVLTELKSALAHIHCSATDPAALRPALVDVQHGTALPVHHHHQHPSLFFFSSSSSPSSSSPLSAQFKVESVFVKHFTPPSMILIW